MTTREILEKTKAAWPSVRSAGADDKNRLLLSMAEHLMHHAGEILFANAQDVEQARGTISEVMLDRLSLSAGRIESMAAGIRDAAALPDPPAIARRKSWSLPVLSTFSSREAAQASSALVSSMQPFPASKREPASATCM